MAQYLLSALIRKRFPAAYSSFDIIRDDQDGSQDPAWPRRSPQVRQTAKRTLRHLILKMTHLALIVSHIYTA